VGGSYPILVEIYVVMSDTYVLGQRSLECVLFHCTNFINILLLEVEIDKNKLTRLVQRVSDSPIVGFDQYSFSTLFLIYGISPAINNTKTLKYIDLVIKIDTNHIIIVI